MKTVLVLWLSIVPLAARAQTAPPQTSKLSPETVKKLRAAAAPPAESNAVRLGKEFVRHVVMHLVVEAVEHVR
jgi:hypothetical protein